MGRKKKYVLKKGAPSEATVSQPKPGTPIPAKSHRLLGGEPTALTAAIIFVIVGFIVFATGLRNGFVGDDVNQIVNNPFVHSLSHLRTLFQGSTFYNGPGQPLIGTFYRPLMMVVFAFLYTGFGAHPFWFHLFQLCLQIACTYVLFLVFRYFLKPAIALVLALIFLIHPINSQAVFSIAAMQEPLFFLFGIAGFWTLLHFHGQSKLYLFLTALLLFLSLLAKETGALFIVMSAAYVFFFDRKRLFPFLAIIWIPVAIYAVLRFHAVGFIGNPDNGPIDELSFWGRLINAPPIIFQYLAAFVAPILLAHEYFWSYKSVTVLHFLIPLVLDLALVVLAAWVGRILGKKGLRRHFAIYLFFAGWFCVGMLLHVQILPLEFTASDTWFYFPMVGLLGMIGVVVEAFFPQINLRIGMSLLIFIVIVFGVRIAVRGLDWHDDYTLASRDIKVSPDDYMSYKQIAFQLAQNGKYSQAQVYADRSVAIFGDAYNYDILGRILGAEGDYPGAADAFSKGMKYQDYYLLYEDQAGLALVYGNAGANVQLLQSALKKFPDDGHIWFDLAILDQNSGDNTGAISAIQEATKYGSGNQYVYDMISNNEPLNIKFDLKDTSN